MLALARDLAICWCYLPTQVRRTFLAMRDAITGLIGRYDQLGRYLDRDAIERISGVTPHIVGMRLPLLRETRMPAVIAEIGPASLVVLRNEQLAEQIVRALISWASAPVVNASPAL